MWHGCLDYPYSSIFVVVAVILAVLHVLAFATRTGSRYFVPAASRLWSENRLYLISYVYPPLSAFFREYLSGDA